MQPRALFLEGLCCRVASCKATWTNVPRLKQDQVLGTQPENNRQEGGTRLVCVSMQGVFINFRCCSVSIFKNQYIF